MDAMDKVRALLTSILIGLIAGGACVLFYACTEFSDRTRDEHGFLLYLLPAAGLLIVFLYDGVLDDKDLSMGALFRHVQEGKPVSLLIAPMIFLSTCLAYLTGGSVGRAGSALQIGGSIGAALGGRGDEPSSARNPLPARDPLPIICGISAGFTAILHAPLAGAVFGLEVLVLTKKSWHYLLPALISSYLTWGIATGCCALLGLTYTDFTVPDAHFTALHATDCAKLALLALAATLIARLYCYSRRLAAWGLVRLLKNPYLRVLAGAVSIVLITKLIGTTEYNGVGFSYAAGALAGDTNTFAFFWKLVLTILTLGCGIRGGEIAPNIFIGATFGCMAGSVLGMDACLCAAVCLICVLSSVTNCTLAIFLYGCEALCHHPAAVLIFAGASLTAHLFSGGISIYRELPSDRIPGKLRFWRPGFGHSPLE